MLSDEQTPTDSGLSQAHPEPGDVLRQAEQLEPDDRLRVMTGIWASLPSWHSASPKPNELAELRKHLEDYDAGQVNHFPWAPVRILMADSKPSPAWRVYSAPRRFDLTTIFIVTLAYSLLFGAMSALSFPAGTSAAIGGFILLVGAGQALLFGGTRPRTASLLVGTLIYSAAMLVVWIINGQRIMSASTLLIMSTYAIVGGAILGYLAGIIVGAVFLIADKLRMFFSRRRRQPGEEQSTPAPDVAIEDNSLSN
jgi:hypothetical protein